MEISKLEIQVLKIMYKNYLETNKIKTWLLPESFKNFGIKNGISVSVINSSQLIDKGLEGTYETWSINDNGIRYMDNNVMTVNKKIWKTQKIKDEKFWAQAQRDGDNVHIFFGQNLSQVKVHIINDLITGEIRIDKSDQHPSEIIDEITTIIKLKNSNGKSIKVVKGKISFEELPL